MDCSPYIAKASARAARWDWMRRFDQKYECLCNAGMDPKEAADRAADLTDEEMKEEG